MSFKKFWDTNLLFNLLPKPMQEEDRSDDFKLMNPSGGTLAENINSTIETIKIYPTKILETSGYIYIGSDNIGVEQIYYEYDPSNPYYLTNCIRNYDGNGSFSHTSGDYLYFLPRKEGQLSRFLRVIESTFDNIYEKTVKLPNLKDPKTCPLNLLPYLSTERGWIDLDTTKSESYQRKFVDFLPEIYKNKGIKSGIEDFIYLIQSIKCLILNYWDFSLFVEVSYGHPSYVCTSAITGTPDDERMYQVRVPSLNADYDEVRKAIRYTRPACQTVEIIWTLFYDDFSVNLPYWSLGSESKKTLINDTLFLEKSS